MRDSAHGIARLDERGAGLLVFELAKDEEAILGRQGVEDDRDVSRVLEAEVALQLHQILPVLHLLEQVMPSRLLAAGERRQHAVAFEQPDDFVLKLVNCLSGCAVGHFPWLRCEPTIVPRGSH